MAGRDKGKKNPWKKGFGILVITLVGAAILGSVYYGLRGGVLGSAKDAPAQETGGETDQESDSDSESADQPANGDVSADPGTGDSGQQTAAAAQPITYVLSFAGDCTLGSDYGTSQSAGSFNQVVGADYAYPLQNCASLFESDDFTIVNLEGTLTTYNVPEDKRFRFSGPPSYVNILTDAGVEFVNLANNHSMDYGEKGYSDTKAALDGVGVAYSEEGKTTLYTTKSGLIIGVYAQSGSSTANLKSGISKLKSEGAEVVLCSFHWGIEGSYHETADQVTCAHYAINCGADIVYGTHPHVLQEIETYGTGIIYYSLGNFSFGGNTNPSDKDTAVIQQKIIREPDGTIQLGDTVRIPYSVSSLTSRNTYQPTPLSSGTAAYQRVLSKLDGTFTGPDLNVSYASGN